MAVTSLKRTRRRHKDARIKRDVDADLLWERPADWPQLPEVLASDSKFVGLYKVEDHDMNHVAIILAVPSGTWNVDWGDGTSDLGVTSGVAVSHTYTYSDPDLTLTSEGFKVAVVVATPATAVNISTINLQTKPAAYGANNSISSGWLEMRMSLPGITSSGSFVVGNGTGILHRSCRNFEYIGNFGVTNGTNMFVGFSSLEQLKVPRSFTANMTNMSSMFNGLSRLKYCPDLDFSAVTNTSVLFSGCTQLRRVPEMNLPVVTTVTNMFQNCACLEYIPDLTTGAITSATSMFSGCASLKHAPAISNTASCTTWSNAFLNCVMLMSIPTYNMSATTTVTAMFSGCSNLEIIPALNFAGINSSANMTNTFNGCSSLRKILATGARFGHTIPSQLGSADLDVYYTNLGTASGAQTLVVTGNATSTDNPAIATAKGWTVTGS